jgi:ParB family chromosome partitioning protein
MNAQHRGLGRGLDALIPKAPTPAPPTSEDLPSPRPAPPAASAPESGPYFDDVPVAAISRNPRQPRVVFDQDQMAELVASVKEVGLLQPIVVRPLEDGRYELVMGERRWRAAEQAGMERVPAIVRDTPDDALLRDALLENLHRAQLNPLEEAAAYEQLLQDFGCTHEELAHRVGRSRPQITNTIRLLKLPPAVQRRVAAGVLSAGHARALLGLDDAEAQDALASRIVAEGISVRGLEELVALGPSPRPPERAARSREMSPELALLAERLGDHLETRCTIDQGRRRGKIVIDYASSADLHRVLEAISADLLK